MSQYDVWLFLRQLCWFVVELWPTKLLRSFTAQLVTNLPIISHGHEYLLFSTVGTLNLSLLNFILPFFRIYLWFFWGYLTFTCDAAQSSLPHDEAICGYNKHLFYPIINISDEDTEGCRTLQRSLLVCKYLQSHSEQLNTEYCWVQSLSAVVPLKCSCLITADCSLTQGISWTLATLTWPGKLWAHQRWQAARLLCWPALLWTRRPPSSPLHPAPSMGTALRRCFSLHPGLKTYIFSNGNILCFDKREGSHGKVSFLEKQQFCEKFQEMRKYWFCFHLSIFKIIFFSFSQVFLFNSLLPSPASLNFSSICLQGKYNVQIFFPNLPFSTV